MDGPAIVAHGVPHVGPRRRVPRRTRVLGLLGLTGVARAGVVALGQAIATAAIPGYTSVGSASTKTPGVAAPNGLSPELTP